VFRYRRPDGGWGDLTARDVNEYLRSVLGVRYSAKDFRTWGGTLRAATVLAELGPPTSPSDGKRRVATAMRLVSAELGNTPAICRRSYVHPIVVAKYLDEGETIALRAPAPTPAAAVVAHTPEERALLAFLNRHFPERRRRPRWHDDAVRRRQERAA
jgi:DNA topoisomerase-1